MTQKTKISCLEQEMPPKGTHTTPQGLGGVKLTMRAVPGHGHPIGAIHRCHSLNCDIKESAKCHPEK